MKLKMVYSHYVKQRILFYRCSGKSLQQIVRSLEERHVATKDGMINSSDALMKWSEVQDDSGGSGGKPS